MPERAGNLIKANKQKCNADQMDILFVRSYLALRNRLSSVLDGVVQVRSLGVLLNEVIPLGFQPAAMIKNTFLPMLIGIQPHLFLVKKDLTKDTQS